MATAPPIRFGLAGLGGYAAFACERLLDEAASPEPAAQLLAVCEPDLDQFAARAGALRKIGVRVCASFDDLLAEPIEAVWLPLPIDLHRSFTESALRAGKAVLCEKPAAGSVDDVDAMIAARDASSLPVAIGFQDAYQPAIEMVKRRVLAGEFGRPTSVQVLGCWPRSQRYYGRNDWAGRFQRDGRWVMDSPAGNALSHFLHLPLLILGPTLEAATYPIDVRAELYRANDIESYDTCSLRFTLPRDIPMHVACTHACAKAHEPLVTIEFDRGVTARYVVGSRLEIHRPDGSETIALLPRPHHHMLATFKRWMREGTAGILGGTLESARAHVVAVNAAAEAAPIHDVPREFIETLPARDHTTIRMIRDIIPALRGCIAQKTMLHQTRKAPWSHTAGQMSINGYTHFKGPFDAAARSASESRPTVEVTISADADALRRGAMSV